MKIARLIRRHSGLPRLLTAAAMTSICVFTAQADVALVRSKYLKDATVTPEVARATAIKTFPGKIISEELEKEQGGSGLRYSFVVMATSVKHEVGVDAKTGAVLENSVEGPDPD